MLATYNGILYLEEQLLSLLHQTKKITIFIRDDGSDDGTLEAIKKYCLQYSNIVFVQDNNSSCSPQENFSHLLEYVYSLNQFSYFMFCDQDDVWFEDKVEKTLAAFEKLEKQFPEQALLVHTDLKIVDSGLSTMCESFWTYNNLDSNKNELRQLLLQNTVTGCTAMINKELAEIALPFPKEILHDWWMAMLASAVGHIGVVPEKTMLYRLHGANSAGIDNYNLKYVVKKFISLFKGDGKNYFMQYIVQGELLYKRTKPMLNKEKKKMLSQFTSLKTGSKIEKIKIIFKYGLFKQGMVRTLGMLLQIVLRKDQ